MSRDFDEADWKRGVGIATLGETMVSRGAGANSVQSFRFGLSKYVGEYMRTAKVDPYRGLIEMRRRLIEVINAAASDDEVNGLAEFYWGLEAWRVSINSQLEARHRLFGSDRDDPDSDYRASDRAVRLLNLQNKDKPCQTDIGLRWKPVYPSDARYKGMVGTVILRADIDGSGHATKPKILAAVPKDVFGKTVLSTLSQLSLSPGKNWGPACALAREGKVITFVFAIR
jgi:TonB family protein